MIESQEQKLKMIDSQFSQNFQIQDPCSIFQVPNQEPVDSDRSMKNMIQSENYFSQSLNKLETQMSHLINIMKYRNEETLPNTCLTILNCPSHIDENQESWCLGDFNQESISSHKLELDQFQILNKLASSPFNKIELECECEPNPQPCDSVPIFESMLTPVSLSNLD